MNRLEHYLTIAAEEGCEVSQRVTKAIRFGLLETQDGQQLNNAERIRREFVDLYATLSAIEREADLPAGSLLRVDADEVFQKQEKIERYFIISRQQGTLP